MTEDPQKIDFENPDGSQFASGDHEGEIVAEDWVSQEGVEGVRYRTWKFKDVSDEVVDGALVEVQQGRRTPVQYVETAHEFQENIQSGRFLLFHVTPDGMAAYRYDSELSDASFFLEVIQGELMCLYVMKDSPVPGEVIECERPGFSSANLQTVPPGTARVGDLEIPPEFWEAIWMLDNGHEVNLPFTICDVNEEINGDES